MSVIQSRPPIKPARLCTAYRDRAYQWRPYLPVELTRLAAYLIDRDYSDPARSLIIDRVKQGFDLISLVGTGDLERDDLADARRYLDAGRKEAARIARRKRAKDAKAYMAALRDDDREDYRRLAADYPLPLRILGISPIRGGAPDGDATVDVDELLRDVAESAAHAERTESDDRIGQALGRLYATVIELEIDEAPNGYE